MAYGKDFATSAKRHLRAATELDLAFSAGSQPGCKAVAGYLYGLAGELALKEIMRASGMKPDGSRRDDPFYAHFPELKTLLAAARVCGRRSGELRKFAESPTLFQYWNTDMRYAKTSDVKSDWVKGWQADAEKLVAALDIF